ncbi:MAG: COX15/CtaA family protein, partial [Bdellovibrionales bacterium]|nr:COX15/CtaA family protein [Bdellovibrionales bacterium]
MVLVGGITRLTHSGLSMVEWKPLMGILPPFTEAEWQAVFLKYQEFPEYKQLNQDMSLSEFKFIFFWEYSHRLLGRIIGLFFFIPFLFFWAKNYFDSRLFKQLLVGLVLGASQGLMGWYMVKSGLVDVPYVSHYRLAAHLMLAFIIEAFLLWIIFEINPKNDPEQQSSYGSAFWGSISLAALTGLQIVYGAFVAGKKAGYGFNSFPLMNG